MRVNAKALLMMPDLSSWHQRRPLSNLNSGNRITDCGAIGSDTPERRRTTSSLARFTPRGAFSFLEIDMCTGSDEFGPSWRDIAEGVLKGAGPQKR